MFGRWAAGLRAGAHGDAAVVSAMVIGTGSESATGTVHTRDPVDGAKRLSGEYLAGAQGADAAAGMRKPKPIGMLRGEMPDADAELRRACAKLEGHYRKPQYVEFAVERGRLYLLDARASGTSAAAMARISVDMVREGLTTREECLRGLDLDKFERLLHPALDPKAPRAGPVARGRAASPGAASGRAVFDAGGISRLAGPGRPVILVLEEAGPGDAPAIGRSAGVLASRAGGGAASPAAIIARRMGRPCVAPASGLRVWRAARRCDVQGGAVIREGDTIAIDGSDGLAYRGDLPRVEPTMTPEIRELLGWAGEAKRLGVRASADTPAGARRAREYGALGIGLCRTERMLGLAGRSALRDAVMAESDDEKRRHLKMFKSVQRAALEKMLEVMAGHPVAVRLLDLPLSELLPGTEVLAGEVLASDLSTRIRTVLAGNRENLAAGLPRPARPAGRDTRARLARARELAEGNPLMGHRGVRIAVTHPEIYEAQIEAVFDAAAALKRRGIDARPQVMVPQVGSASELAFVKGIFDGVAARKRAGGARVRVAFGTMIEVVRAALTAGELVGASASFFSFGTNDLTQATYSFSREDAEGKFLPQYLDKGLLGGNPFESLDRSGVGRLVEIAVEDGRRADPGLEIGICGEHGGDPASIRFCHAAGVSYVSAPAHRVPIAIVAAAQAALDGGGEGSRRAAPRPCRASDRKRAARSAARRSPPPARQEKGQRL